MSEGASHLGVLVCCGLLVELREGELRAQCFRDGKQGIPSRPLELDVRHLVHQPPHGDEGVLLGHGALVHQVGDHLEPFAQNLQYCM